ncbi:MAG: hypothetical protein ACK5NK_01565 [Niabella sp.]
MKRYIDQNRKNILVTDRTIDKATRTVLIILWAGALVLIAIMVYRWQKTNESATSADLKISKELYVDDMLLNSGDLELNNTSSLINITLNAVNEKPFNITQEQSKTNTDLVYKKILTQKIKKANTQYKNGFTIKPLPQ